MSISNPVRHGGTIAPTALDAVLSDIPPDALKTGMLSNTAIVEVVAGKVREYGLAKLVIDPVMQSWGTL